MNATELVKISEDDYCFREGREEGVYIEGIIKSTDLWQCECGKLWNDEGTANRCRCKTPWICERCQRPAYDFHTYCSDCEDFLRMEKAELIENWDSWIYVKEFSRHNEGYYESVEDFLDYEGEEYEYDDEADQPKIPEFAFCCKEVPFPSFDLERLLDGYMDDFEDGEAAYDRLEGTHLLQKALDWFSKKNEHNVKYYPDYKRKVRLK